MFADFTRDDTDSVPAWRHRLSETVTKADYSPVEIDNDPDILVIKQFLHTRLPHAASITSRHVIIHGACITYLTLATTTIRP